VANLCRLLKQGGAEVTVASRVTWPGVPAVAELRRLGVEFLATPFHHGGRASTAWAMAFWPLRLRQTFDVLYSFDLIWFTAFLAKFVRPGGYVLGTRWGPPRLPEVSPAARKVFDGMLLESELQAECYREFLPAAAIPHLARVAGVSPRESRRVDELRVAYLGRMNREKGIFRLIDCWPDLSIQPARLDFYGDGPELKGLESEVRTRGLRNICLHGRFDGSDLPKILEQTDLVVLPSDSEGLPLVLMESMAYGVPFVASDVGAIRTLAKDNPDVCVVPLNDAALKLGIERMAGAIRRGEIDGQRLQKHHHDRYGYDLVAGRWLKALLQPEEFWASPATASPQYGDNRVQEPVGGGVRA